MSTKRLFEFRKTLTGCTSLRAYRPFYIAAVPPLEFRSPFSRGKNGDSQSPAGTRNILKLLPKQHSRPRQTPGDSGFSGPRPRSNSQRVQGPKASGDDRSGDPNCTARELPRRRSRIDWRQEQPPPEKAPLTGAAPSLGSAAPVNGEITS